MTAATLPRPASTDDRPADDEYPIHLTCCDPHRSLCGLNVTDLLEASAPVRDEDICGECLLADLCGVPCGAQGCSEGAN